MFSRNPSRSVTGADAASELPEPEAPEELDEPEEPHPAASRVATTAAPAAISTLLMLCRPLS
jgi:hypothetical protein